jgi:hypothetical protein
MVKPIKRRSSSPHLPQQLENQLDEAIRQVSKSISERMNDSQFIMSGTPPTALQPYRRNFFRGMSKQDMLRMMISGGRQHVVIDAITNSIFNRWVPPPARNIPTLMNQERWGFDYQDALQLAEGIQPSEPRKEYTWS